MSASTSSAVAHIILIHNHINHIEMALPLSQLANFSSSHKKEEPKDAAHGETAESCGVCGDFRSIRRTNFGAGDAAEKLKTATKSSAGAESSDPYEPFDCPPDSAELGNSTWNFLHTMAAYYPSKASDDDKRSMGGLIEGLGKFYPCNECSSHLRKEIVKNPPLLDGNKELSKWFCDVHNEVNRRQGKPEFDCTKAFERWRTGRPGDGCFPGQ